MYNRGEPMDSDARVKEISQGDFYLISPLRH